MHWLIYFALGYLAFCAIGVFVVCKLCPNSMGDERLAQLLKAHPIRMALGLLVALPLFPVILLTCVWKCWQVGQEWQRFARTYRPVEFKALLPDEVPPEAKQHFRRCTLTLQQSGFKPSVICQTKPEPHRVLTQCLLSQEGAAVADVSWIEGTPALSFTSVLENGHCLETACVEVAMPEEEIEAINNSGTFSTQMLEIGEGGDFAEEAIVQAAYSLHLQKLSELEEVLGCGTLHLSAEEIPALKRYENAVFGELQYQRGQFGNRPEPQPRPRGVVRSISESIELADDQPFDEVEVLC